MGPLTTTNPRLESLRQQYRCSHAQTQNKPDVMPETLHRERECWGKTLFRNGPSKYIALEYTRVGGGLPERETLGAEVRSPESGVRTQHTLHSVEWSKVERWSELGVRGRGFQATGHQDPEFRPFLNIARCF